MQILRFPITTFRHFQLFNFFNSFLILLWNNLIIKRVEKCRHPYSSFRFIKMLYIVPSWLIATVCKTVSPRNVGKIILIDYQKTIDKLLNHKRKSSAANWHWGMSLRRICHIFLVSRPTQSCKSDCQKLANNNGAHCKSFFIVSLFKETGD